MKRFSFSKLPLAIIFTSILIFSSCKKDTNTNSADNPDPALTSDAALNESSTESQFEDVFDITMGIQSSDAGENIGLGTGAGILYSNTFAERNSSADTVARCFTVTVIPNIAGQFPKTVTFDFGSGCLGKDGKLRSGKIVTIFTGPMIIPGSKTSTTFINYSVDSFKVEGTYTVENTSTSNKRAWATNVINGKITNTQTNNWVEWNATRERIQTEGNGTPLYFLDDVYQITGNSQGINSKGNEWTSTITQPIIRKYSCRWRSKGEITVTRKSNTKTAILDYGDGSCDNKATLTVNGVSKVITLP